MWSPDDIEPEPDAELGPGSMWVLRLGSVVFLLVLGWFLIDAIIG